MLLMLVYFSSAQLAQSQAVAPPALLPLYPFHTYARTLRIGSDRVRMKFALRKGKKGRV